MVTVDPRVRPWALIGALAWTALQPASAQVPLDPELGRLPVEARIMSAPVFEEPLVWVGSAPPAIEESEALWAAINLMREHGPALGFEALEIFIEEFPDSAWTPALRSNLGFA